VIEPTARSPWIVAAEAMRTRDYRSAERAFDELVNSPDPHTRDAARLARAEVWIAEGRVGEARSELEALRAVGATASIRNRASEAFQSLLP
jgi:thioredoxin-like negative regulator of GroEL